jgi:hypothetical protein
VCSRYLEKPLSIERLLQALRRIESTEPRAA